MQFKAVFLDQKLGDNPRKGLDLLPEIKQKYPDLAVIMYTATLDDLGDEAISRGAYWYLNKLFVSPYELANMLDNVVRMRQMRDEHATLFEENELLKSLLDAIDQEIMVRKPDGTILWVNKAKIKAFPGLAEAMKGPTPITCHQFWGKKSQHQPCVYCISQKAIETKQIQSGPWFYEEAECDQEIMGFPITNDAGDVTAVVELVRDVTRTRHLHDFAERVVALEAENEETFWSEVARLIADKLHFRRVRVYRVVGVKAGEQRTECVASKGYEPSADPKGKGLPFFGTLKCQAGEAAALEPAITCLAAHDPAHQPAIRELIDPAEEWLLIPVHYEGVLQWQISLDNKGLLPDRPFSETDLEAARFVARVLSDAVANRQLQEDLQWIRKLQQVLDLARDTKEAANGLLEAAKKNGLCDFGKVIVQTHDGKRLRTLPTDQHLSYCWLCKVGQSVEDGLNGKVFRTGIPEFIEEAKRDALIGRFRKKYGKQLACDICRDAPAMAALPLKAGKTVVGILEVFFKTPHSFSDREKRLLKELAGVLSSSLSIAHRVERAQNVILQTHSLASRAFVLGGMAHRIRGLLSNLGPGLDILIHHNLTKEDVSRKAVKLKKVLGDVETVFETAMVIRREQSLKPQVFSIEEVLNELVRINNLEHRHSRVRVRREFKKSPRVHCTRQALEMALDSLLQNAYDAVRSKGGEIKVEVDSVGTEAVVVIQDNGPGFPADMVLDPSCPVERPTAGHSGMGLYFANWALDEMGGYFEMKRAKTGWTTVTVHIPLYKGGAK